VCRPRRDHRNGRDEDTSGSYSSPPRSPHRLISLSRNRSDETALISYQGGRCAVRRPVSSTEPGQRPKPRRETSSPVPAPPL